MAESSISKHHRGEWVRQLALSIGSELRRARVAAGLTQRELAAPMTGAYISLIERGRTLPSLPALAVLTERLGLGLDVFFERINFETTPEYTPRHEHNRPPARRRR